VSRRRTELLAEALGALDPIHREVLLLRDIQEQSAPQAAARLGISVDALKSRLHRARVNLRDYVRAHADEF
jgi:RNA polymerase sigma-70 factor (ECF subfamily)